MQRLATRNASAEDVFLEWACAATTLALLVGLIGGVLKVPKAAAQQRAAQRAKASSDEPEPLVIPKIEGTIELDGRPGEPAWDDARRLPVVQQRPNFGNDPTEKTDVLVAYTDEALYVACRCYDRSEPTAPTFKRDYTSSDSDFIALILDTFNDNILDTFVLPHEPLLPA